MRKGVEADAVAALSPDGGTLRIMAYAFRNEQFAKGVTPFRIAVKFPEGWAGREIAVTRTQVDDDANWFDEWRAERTKRKKKDASSTKDFTVSTVTYFGTTDENGNACTVTDDGVINSYGSAAQIHFDGKGTFVANAVGTATCPVTVHGGTLAINSGKQLTTGEMTVNDKATLALQETGTVAMAGELELKPNRRS